MTVVETEEFLKAVEPLMSEAERERLVAFLAANPEIGEIIQETGGVRKFRRGLYWSRQTRGVRE